MSSCITYQFAVIKIFLRGLGFYIISILKYFGVKKIDQRPKHVVLWNFLFGFFAPETSLTFLLKRKKNLKKLFCFKMLQVSVFTIKFWSIVSERRVSDFVNLSTITNHSEQHLYFEIENSTPNRSYLTSPHTRRNINVTNYSCMLEKAINYAGKTKLLLNLISRANFNFFKQLNKYQDELDRDLKRNTIWHSRRNSRLFIEHMFKIYFR